MSQAESYVQYRDGNWYVGDGRVELYSVVAAWQQGYSPEEVRAGFPHLSLTQVYGAILFYLERKDELDRFFREVDANAAQIRSRLESENAAFYAKMRERVSLYMAGEDRERGAVPS